MDAITGMAFLTKGASHVPEAIGKLSIFWKLALVAFGIFWIVMLTNCLQRKFKVATDKLAWVGVFIFLPAIGALIYLYDLVKLRRK